MFIWSSMISSNLMRIFLLGDSLIGQMCRDTKFCGRADDGTLDMVDLKPNYTSQSNWPYFRMHHLNGFPQIKIFHLGQYGGNVTTFEKELFWTFKPRSFDILIILFGAHIHSHFLFEDFITRAYNRLAMPFPGKVFWFEPFPQHFQRGAFDLKIESTTKHLDCFPLTPERNATQFWKASTVKSIVKETSKIKFVPTYDLLAKFDRCHKEVQFLQKNGNRDCTHYSSVAYTHVWRQLKYVT